MAEEGGDAEDKTEDPSQRRLDEAHERGDVAKSQEVPALFLLAGTTATVAFLANGMARDLARPLVALFDHAHEIAFDRRGLTEVYLQSLKILLGALALPAIVFFVAGIAGHMVQHRLVWTLEPLMPKFSKINPMAGFGRLFSLENAVNLLKGIIKLIVVGWAMWLAVKPELPRFDLIVATDTAGLLAVTQSISIRLMIAVMIVMAFVAALDYMFQRYRWYSKLRMTKQEQKEEYKNQEGNPEVKAKIRQLRVQRAKKRMMAEVPKSTVVVTNPTHFAVALRYEQGMQAPICTAKGVDAIALKIREVAKGANVPIIENPPLARALYAAVDLDEEIPEEHYKAVAELVGYVMRLRQKRGWRPN